MATISGVFDSQIVADRAVSELMDNGFSKDDISLIMSHETHKALFDASDNGLPDDAGKRITEGGLAGATAGGVLGAILAGLTAVGAIVTTSGGALLMSGPIVAVLSGVGAGAIAGGVAGALIRAGFAADEANHYAEEIKRGKAVLVVHVNDSNKAMLARNALQRAGAMILEAA